MSQILQEKKEMNINDLNEQIIITDNNYTRYFEIHKEGKILGGYDFLRDRHLTEKDCQEILKNLNLNLNYENK